MLVQMLDDRPGQRQAVEGGGAAAYLVQDHQAIGGALVKDVGGLDHLGHEGGLAACQVVAGADPGEYAIHHGNAGAVGGHEAAGLRHQHDQRHLPEIGRLAAHVGAGEQDDLR